MTASPSLSLPGAVAAEPPDDAVPAHYGDPYREQRLLSEGGGLVDRSSSPVLRISGADRLSWLHSLTSQHLTGLERGTAAEALILSPHGHVEHALALVDDGTATWLHVEPGTAGALITFLRSMQFMLDVEVSDVSGDYALLWSPAGAAADLDVPVRRETRLGTDLFLPRSSLGAVLHDRRATLAGLDAYEALRVAAGLARLGRDTDHKTLPHEAGWIGTAVHLNKGCYRGQETVARVHNLGRPPRRLVRLHLDGSADRLPAPGSPVQHEGADIGFCGTAVRHFELGPLALALVKRSVPPEAPLIVEGIAAAQEEIVPADTGPAVDVPRLGAGLMRHRRP